MPFLLLPQKAFAAAEAEPEVSFFRSQSTPSQFNKYIIYNLAKKVNGCNLILIFGLSLLL